LGETHVFLLVKRWNLRTNAEASPRELPRGTALSLTIPPTFLALADEVIE